MIESIISKVMSERDLTLRSLADALNEKLDGQAITHGAISHWISGRSLPGTDLLVTMLLRYRDWRFDLALDLLQAKRPDIWGPDGIWAVNPRREKP